MASIEVKSSKIDIENICRDVNIIKSKNPINNMNYLIPQLINFVFDNSLLREVKKELEEIVYDLHQKPGSPPIP